MTFVNRLSKKVTLDVYRTFEDYANSTNPILRKTLAANEKSIYPEGMLVNGTTYYMDWYTDDLYNNNWFNDKFPTPGSQVAFTPQPSNNTYYLETGFKGKARLTFLGVNSNQSTWTAVNAYLFSNSTGYVSYWNQITQNEKYRAVTVKKDCVAEYSYKNASGSVVTDNMDFKVQNTDNAYIEFIDLSGNSLGYMSTGTSPVAAPPDYASTSTDSVLALFPNSSYYYLLIRQ